MFCPQCGEKVQEEANFCVSCGYKLKIKEESSIDPPETQSPELENKSHQEKVDIALTPSEELEKEGLVKTYYESGRLQSEENYKNGEPEGLLVYHEDGTLKCEDNYVNGKMEGLENDKRELEELQNTARGLGRFQNAKSDKSLIEESKTGFGEKVTNFFSTIFSAVIGILLTVIFFC